MDFEYACKVYPNIPESDSATEISLCPVDQFFNVEFEIRNVHDATHSDTYRRRFCYISKDNMMQENVQSLLSSVGLPNDAFKFVVPEILEGADDIANRMYKNRRILSMVVYIVVTPASHEDEIDDDEDDDDDDDDDDDYDDDGFEEYLEEGDEDFGLVPAALTSIEELEMQEEFDQEGNCAICYEDFHVGVRMPCLHMFHKNCITSWLQVANSCPLCRFQMSIIDEQNK